MFKLTNLLGEIGNLFVLWSVKDSTYDNTNDFLLSQPSTAVKISLFIQNGNDNSSALFYLRSLEYSTLLRHSTIKLTAYKHRESSDNFLRSLNFSRNMKITHIFFICLSLSTPYSSLRIFLSEVFL